MTKNNPRNISKIIFHNTNNIRKKHGCITFRYDKGLSYLCRKHSKKMAKKERIWHGNNIFLTKDYITDDKISLLDHFLLWLFGGEFAGISGENCAMMSKGNVKKGFTHRISTDKDIAIALNQSWMNSPGHKANILNKEFKKIGTGVYRRKNNFYATALFYG